MDRTQKKLKSERLILGISYPLSIVLCLLILNGAFSIVISAQARRKGNKGSNPSRPAPQKIGPTQSINANLLNVPRAGMKSEIIDGLVFYSVERGLQINIGATNGIRTVIARMDPAWREAIDIRAAATGADKDIVLIATILSVILKPSTISLGKEFLTDQNNNPSLIYKFRTLTQGLNDLGDVEIKATLTPNRNDAIIFFLKAGDDKSTLIPDTKTQNDERNAEWKLIERTEDYSFYLNIKRVSKTESGTVISWEKWIPRSDTEKGIKARREFVRDLSVELGLSKASSFSFVGVLIEYNCAASKKRGIRILAYDNSGVALKELQNSLTEWAYAIPGSATETMMIAACNLTK